MSEDNQLFMPASFVAVYVPLGKQRPTLGRAELAARYELCEDMAQMLTIHASEMQLRSDATSGQVLEQCLQGLSGPEAPVAPEEARWVVSRLAELLQWPPPAWQPAQLPSE
ncbi:MAG: ATPase with chaperone activity [Betaproteobacteria bacterium]|nr:ATPase with chaperone activity [Betaproteobacteria bacterium]